MYTRSSVENAERSVLKDLRLQWRLMNAYERFEQLVVLALGLIIAAVIVMALAQRYRRVVPLLIGGAIDLLDHIVCWLLREQPSLESDRAGG